MPTVERFSLEYTLQDEIADLPPADQRTCVALLAAIRCVQSPEWFGHLPDSLLKALDAWDRERQQSWRRDPALVRREVERFHAKGMPKSRSDGDGGSPTAFAEAARLLGIPESSVISIYYGTSAVTGRATDP